jgi:hypothetical protein
VKRTVFLLTLVAANVFAQERQICLEPREAQHIAQYIERTEAERDALKKEILNAPSPVIPAVIVGIAAALLFGGIGVAVGSQIKKP